MTTTTLIQSPAYELSIELRHMPEGHHLKLVSFVPAASRPERQVRFQTMLDIAGLEALQRAICQALEFERQSALSPDGTYRQQPEELISMGGRACMLCQEYE